jgi:hypothetical protein
MNKLYYLLLMIGFLTFAGCSGYNGLTVVDPASTFNMNCTNCGSSSGGITIINGNFYAKAGNGLYNSTIGGNISTFKLNVNYTLTANKSWVLAQNYLTSLNYAVTVNRTYLNSRNFMTSFNTGKGLMPLKITNGTTLLINYSNVVNKTYLTSQSYLTSINFGVVANKTWVSSQGYLTAEVDGDITNEIQNIIASKGLQRDGSNNFGLINCANDQVLKYNTTSSAWACKTLSTSAGGVTSIKAGTGLTGGNITTAGTIALNTTYISNVLDSHDINYLTNVYDTRFTGLQQRVIGSVKGYGNTEKGYWRYFSEYNSFLGDGASTGTITYTEADANVWGVLNCATGSTKGNDCAVSATSITTNAGVVNATKILKYEILTKATETTFRRQVLGVFRTQSSADLKKTSVLSGAGAEGFGFYSSTNTSDYFTSSWKAYTCRGGTCTVQNTTINLDTAWHKFTIIPYLDGYTTKWVAFYVDGVLKNNITTNLPLALVNVAGAYVETDRAGASNFKIDTMLIEATR